METIREIQSLEPYAGYLALSKSPQSLVTRSQVLRVFKAFIDGRGMDPFDVDRKAVLEFVGHLKKPGTSPGGRPRKAYSPAAIHCITMTVRKLYAYLVALGQLEQNPTAILAFQDLEKPKRLPRALHPMERIALVNALRWETWAEVRTSLMVLLGYHCGLRRGEIAGAMVEQVDLPRKSIRIIGKGDKERELYLTDELVGAFREWFKVRMHRKSPFLFPNKFTPMKSHVKDQCVNGWVRVAARWAGLKPLTVHVLRHTYGTQLAETGTSCYVIRDLMGHSTIFQSEVYVKVASGAGREACDRAFNSGKDVYGQGHPLSSALQVEGEVPPPWRKPGDLGGHHGDARGWGGGPLRHGDGALVLPGVSKAG